MNTNTPATPIRNAFWLASLESWPRVGPTVRFSMISSFTGREPLRSKIARCWASSIVRLPVIWALPPVMASCTVGAVSTSPSRVMAIRLPTFRAVTSANFLPPSSENSMDTRGWFPLPTTAFASFRSVPVNTVTLLGSLNSSIAVLPSILMAFSGSLTPGSSTMIRSRP